MPNQKYLAGILAVHPEDCRKPKKRWSPVPGVVVLVFKINDERPEMPPV